MQNSLTEGHSVDQSVVKALLIAARIGDLTLCAKVFENWNLQNGQLSSCSGCNPVLISLVHRHKSVTEYLLSKDASTQGQLCSHWKSRGYTAVHIAAGLSSDWEILRLSLKADLEAGSPAFRAPVSPIHVAAACQNRLGLKIILSHCRNLGWTSQRTTSKAQQLNSKYSCTLGIQQMSDLLAVPWQISEISICDSKIDTSQLKTNWELSVIPGCPPRQPFINTNMRFIHNATALHIAAYRNDFASAIVLLEYGASVDSLNANKSTPLHIAAVRNALATVQILLHYGANINARDLSGDTPVMLAALYGHDMTLHYIISRGASYSKRDMSGFTIVHHACRRTISAKVLSKLLSMGCSLRSKDFYNTTPLDLVFENGRTSDPALFVLLLNWNFDFFSFGALFSNSSFLNPRIPVTVFKRLVKRIPKISILHEINKRQRNGLGDSPLVEAVKIGKLEAVKFLISAGAELDFKGSVDGLPALHTACEWGRIQCVSYLLRAGANEFTCLDGVIYTAVQAASSFPDIVRWLLVERYTDQHKICWEASESEGGDMSPWSGVVVVEVPIANLYSPIHGASSLDRIKELSQLRRYLRGKVVYY